MSPSGNKPNRNDGQTRLSYWRAAGRTWLDHQTGSQGLSIIALTFLFAALIWMTLPFVPQGLQWLWVGAGWTALNLYIDVRRIRYLNRLNIDLRLTPMWPLRWYYLARRLLVTPLFGLIIVNPAWIYLYAGLYIVLRRGVEGPYWSRHKVLILRRFGGASTDRFSKSVWPVAAAFGQPITLADRDLRPLWSRLAFQWSPMRYTVADNGTWQSKVVELLQNANLVIIDGTERSDALQWEIREASRLRQDATILITAGMGSPNSGKQPDIPTLYLQDNRIEFQTNLGRMLSNLKRAMRDRADKIASTDESA